MFINLTIALENKSYDIRIDSEQSIGSGLSVLRAANKLPYGKTPNYFHSKINEKPVSAYKTFSEELVFDGDLLTAIIS
jgi:hypothetical protein